MARMSRRTFVATATALPFALWFDRYAYAKTPFVRYSALSPQGKKMLKAYAKAVAVMHGRAQGDPTGWLFQWYTHAVRPDRTKAGEIASIYPSPSPQKTLAQAAWSTCQAHFNPAAEDLFLPWHRIYVYLFERMVRKASGMKTFTLPYWDYSISGAAHGVIPVEFRRPKDALFKSLYMKNRNARTAPTQQIPNVNAGEPIDKFDAGALDLTALGQCTYSPLGAQPGFCQMLDFGLHGNVHVDTGNTTNMGSVPWAARDPVFWVHHCNIDRLWASWNKAGRTNPTSATFLNQQFTFSDENGHSVNAKVGDFVDIAHLGYTYESYESAPPCKSKPARAITLFRVSHHALAPAAKHVDLTKAPGPEAAEIKLSTLVPSLQADEGLFLVIKNLQTNVNPGVLYHVYLNLPEGIDPKGAEEYKVGVINFFHVSGHGADHAAAAEPDDRFYSFEVTGLLKELLAKGQLSDQLSVVIAPTGEPPADAVPVVGDISLVQQ